MAKSIFVQALNALKAIGAFRVIFPFILIFSIIFGILERTDIFGEEAADINALVSFSIAILFVGAGNAVGTLTQFVPWVSLLSVFLISVVMVVALFYEDISKVAESNWKWVVITIAVIWLILSLLYSMGMIETLLGTGGGGGGGGAEGAPSGFAWLWNTYGIPVTVLIITVGIMLWLTGLGRGGEE